MSIRQVTPEEKGKLAAEHRWDLDRQQLQREHFDHLNFRERMHKYEANIRNIDVAIQDAMDLIHERRSEIEKVKEHKDVKNLDWSRDIWYRLFADSEKIISSLHTVVSYKDWQLMFMSMLLEKIASVLDSVRGASEEKIMVETMKENMKEFMGDMREINKENAAEMRATMKLMGQQMQQLMMMRSQQPGPVQQPQQASPSATPTPEAANRPPTEEVREAILRKLQSGEPQLETKVCKEVADELGDNEKRIWAVVQFMKRKGQVFVRRERNKSLIFSEINN